MKTTKEILDFINEKYPLANASDFDKGKVGMQFGSFSAQVSKVMLALDTTEAVIDEAIAKGANLIISHHPFMFSPLVNLNYDSPFGKMLTKVIKHQLNIMAFHTNFDVAEDGMNDELARLLDLNDIHYVTDSIGVDSFLRVGSTDLTLEELLLKIKKAFQQDAIRYVGNLNQRIKTVGIVGGSGSTEMFEAINAGCDAYITGQIPHHLGLEAKNYNLSIIEVSHAIEFYGVKHLKEVLAQKFSDLEFFLASVGADPFKII